jgi:zinc transporter, ZIP family
MMIDAFLGALLVFLATAAGAFLIFLVRGVKRESYNVLLSFAAGVMAFSSIEMLVQAGRSVPFEKVAISFVVGFLILLLIERTLPHMHPTTQGSKLKTALLVGAIAIHNIPEGFAVGAAFAGSPALGWFVATSIAIQDIPEGLLISAPLFIYGKGVWKSALWGALSGVSEGLAAILGYLFLEYAKALTPVALSIAAGAMGYVVMVEILPDAFREEGKKGMAALSFILGFLGTFGLAWLLRI